MRILTAELELDKAHLPLISLATDSFFKKIVSFDNEDRVHTGDETFDKRYVIESADPDLVKKLFPEETRKKLTAKHINSASFLMNEDHFNMEVVSDIELSPPRYEQAHRRIHRPRDLLPRTGVAVTPAKDQLKEPSMPVHSFQVRVQPALDPPGLRLRAQASTSAGTIAFEAPGSILTVLEPQTQASAKIGINGQWLKVRDANAREGYVAAWYVEALPAAPVSVTAPTAESTPPVSAPSPQALVEAINAEREKNKLPALKVSPILTKNAQRHADFMAASGSIQHESADGSRPYQRHLAAGYPLAGDLTRGGICSENIVANPNMTIAEALVYWYGDDPHTHTMLGDQYTECGAGVAWQAK
ncbi:MAG: SH3 domain-containing protein [Anaerolineales bacterium]|uniref:CAP domain-containing protein n=1 Tax=Candidatus Villigracilis vicinus TaxID=3140679 RepID=UPI003136343B|nr:SH3 domain-containing protein [Anaerolineales bacterium]